MDRTRSGGLDETCLDGNPPPPLPFLPILSGFLRKGIYYVGKGGGKDGRGLGGPGYKIGGTGSGSSGV